MVYYKIPLTDGLDYPAGCILICAYDYDGYEYCKFERVTDVGTHWMPITEAEFNVRCPDFPEPEYTGTVESAAHPGCFYRLMNGEQEWINPPMIDGVVYRTTERYAEKPIYITKITTAFPVGDTQTAIPSEATIVESYGVLCYGKFPNVQISFQFPAFDANGCVATYLITNQLAVSMPDTFHFYDLQFNVDEEFNIGSELTANITIKYILP